MGYIGQAPANKAITSADIEDSIITAADLGANSVDSSELVDGSIDTSHIGALQVTEAKIAADAVTLAKMASGTDGNIISYDASGNPVAIATGNDGQVLTSAGAGQPPAFEAVSAGTALTGSTNNQLTTVTGANAIQGESGLTFDGTTFSCLEAFVFNDSNSAFDARFASDTDTHCLFVDGSADKVGIGVSDPDAKLEVNGKFKVSNSLSGDNIAIFENTASDGYGAFFRGGGGNTGQFLFKLLNYNNAEKLRMDGDGNLGIGTTSPVDKFHVVESASHEISRFECTNTGNGATLFKIKCDNTTGSQYVFVNIDKAGYSQLNIHGDGDVENVNNSYGAISDERIKKDITDANSQWEDIKALKVKNYKLKADDTAPTQLGVIAQDLETAGMNGLIREQKPDEGNARVHSDFGTIEAGTEDNGAEAIKDEDGNITGYEDVFTEGQKVKAVKYSVLYMKAIKALQESMERIEQLEAKVTALENA